MRQIKSIIFDAGGTLVQGAMPWYQLYSLALEMTFHPMPLRKMATAYETAIQRMVTDRQNFMTGEPGPAASLNTYLAREFGLSEGRLRNALDEVLFDHPEGHHLVRIDGAQEVLACLQSRGYRLGVISNWSADLPRVLSQLGIGEYLEAVFASEAIGYSKPNAAAFLIPLDRMGLTPGVSAYVGDLYPVDVEGSRGVGMLPVLVDPLRLGLHPDVETVGDLRDLLEMFTGA